MLKTTFQSATCRALGIRVNWYKQNKTIYVKTLTIKGYRWLQMSVTDFMKGYLV